MQVARDRKGNPIFIPAYLRNHRSTCILLIATLAHKDDLIGGDRRFFNINNTVSSECRNNEEGIPISKMQGGVSALDCVPRNSVLNLKGLVIELR